MNPNTEQTDPAPVHRSGRRLRTAGWIVLLLGIAAAGLVYWLGTRSPDVQDDISMVGYNRAQRRQMGQLYGKMGLAVEQFADDLKQPGTQAKIILGFSVVVALGCFYVARLREQRGVHDDTTGLS